MGPDRCEFWLESDRFSLSPCRGRISEPDCFLFAHFLYGVNCSAISLSLTLIRKKISTILRGGGCLTYYRGFVCIRGTVSTLAGSKGGQ